MRTIIVYGPRGSGKTTHREEIVRRLGATGFRDNWLPGDRLDEGYVHFLQATEAPDVPMYVECISIEEVR